MTRLADKNKAALTAAGYKMLHWDAFDYSILKYIKISKRSNKGADEYNDAWIMFDTETSKKKIQDLPAPCHVVAFTISIRAYHTNIVTLYGHDPRECIEAISRIIEHMPAHNTLMFAHNLSYDWTFLRQFFFEKFGLPDKQLNTKPYYPIYIKWENGLQLRDSLILAQRGIEKWANDMMAEHRKAVGSWDYLKIRNQKDPFTADELKYIECDTLAGVECLDITAMQISARLPSMPYTATGIPRNEARKRGKKNRARQNFEKQVNPWDIQMCLELLFHGGYTHGNRYATGWIEYNVQCMDFASSYPYSCLTEKMPDMQYKPSLIKNIKPQDIVDMMDDYSHICLVLVFDFELKDPMNPMPMLQYSKCILDKGCVLDNGRIMKGHMVQIWMNEFDLAIFLEQYDFPPDKIHLSDVYYATKSYLPRWYTDYIYELFKDKTMLKGVDPVRYQIKKATLNSASFGLMVQKPCKPEIVEEYVTGEYKEKRDIDLSGKYDKYVKNRNNILNYAWGIVITSSAMYRLFQLAKCIDYEHGGRWLYSDTDSIYSDKWDEKKLEEYNKQVKKKLLDRGYGPVIRDGREYWLGVAEKDAFYQTFCEIGAKRYAGTDEKGEIHITVAGVPKKGAACLKDLNEFKPGFVFPGSKTGKKQHTYFFENRIYEDEFGNICGDSIDLTPCDYTLDSPYEEKSEDQDDDIFIQVYEEERGRDAARGHY